MRAFLLAAGMALLTSAAPAMAGNDHDQTPPGNPCARDNGNPCNGNNGNAGQQGNSGGKVETGTPAPFHVDAAYQTGRSAYITQIGSSDRATIDQPAANAYARIDQNGDGNGASIAQKGSASAYAVLQQKGDANTGAIIQDGSGANAAYLLQTGSHNASTISQTARGGADNGAIVAQNGSNDLADLLQDGSDNQALLTQNGDGDRMTASQTGNGNRLVWTQNGNNLADLAISQTGGQAIQVTQSR